MRFDLTPAFCMIACWICLAPIDTSIHLSLQRGNMVGWGWPRCKDFLCYSHTRTVVLRAVSAKPSQLKASLEGSSADAGLDSEG